MTCIVALIDDDKVYMGCDSRATFGNTEIVNTNIEKIFFKDDFLIGVCGNLRYLNLLRYRFNPPKLENDLFIQEYLNVLFSDEIRSCLEKSKYSEEKDGISEIPGNSRILVGYKNKIYSIGSCYDVIELINYYAAGSGADYAMGSLETTKDMNLDPKERIELALKIACKFDSACSAPFFILEGIP